MPLGSQQLIAIAATGGARGDFGWLIKKEATPPISIFKWKSSSADEAVQLPEMKATFDAFPRKSAANRHTWSGVHARASDWMFLV